MEIEHQCPQCGAPVVLDEADRLLSCSFCRTKLYLSTPNHFRYQIPSVREKHSDMVYLPYWRLKGNSFTVFPNEIVRRFIDKNILAAHVPLLPNSLGVRPQAMKVKFLSSEMEGQFLNVDRQYSGLVDDVKSLSGAAVKGRPYFYKAFIGETISLIYSPAYIENNVLYDAFTKKRLRSWQPEKMEQVLSNTKPPNWQLRFVSTLCPRCGWDLQGDKDALVLICRNCDSAWHCPQGKLEAVSFSVLPTPLSDETIYLPFWRMKPTWEGITLASYADLIRVANLPKKVQDIFESQPLYFWSPAFKVNPALFLRLARQMTIDQPNIETNLSFRGAAFSQVTLSMQEAVESMMITMASLVKNKRRIYPDLVNIGVIADDIRLVYQPFKIGHREFTHPSLPIAIDRQAMHFSVYL
ncbi:MAG: hypothetical protein JXA41_03800 [Deltaproteobacteria bacterium]|nr:hypothetical protein [Deltaproteobacteria bacterium]